ncbi:DegT/DnrJ/EryC1/StrS aminotransferase [Candidatus Scalindua japonica]|uniref:DegT/DnrJ/EryC1/StrS aminotransferase n=1 Tax=Candidatus Scalindua japonica TaxID=1284222 RepID=A0A286U4C6_9BACT|nr:aminotransferase class I/II-fold pyridoxal phosphate-dependent enzyme [Candidatus Scalindua japonica]GAX62975.1 DegT/DnrJ/EryC1/StrS aminotransferase [Candidatus Scalindua japonica]
MIKTVKNLAIFGGKPAFNEVLHVGCPNIGNRQRFLKYINDILDQRWLTNRGHYVREFEQKIADLIGVKHCIAMCNGTVALEIAIRALDLRGEVIIPSFTFIATAHALQWQEITPVFCDIDPDSHNIDPGRVEELITPRTTGIIGVHIWGRPCDVKALAEIAQRRNLKLLYDAAHAFACSHSGQKIGNFGDAEVFSFHATKFFNSLEGGAVVTNNDELATKIRLMKNFGFDGMDNVTYIGTNGKMNEVSAAMGLVSLESLDEFININRQNYDLYHNYLSCISGINLQRYDESEDNNFHYIIMEIDIDKIEISRDQLMNILHAENVRVRRYFYPSCHRMEPYRSYYPTAGLLLPETEKLSERVLCLPTGSAVRPEDIKEICQIIGFAVEHGDEISSRLTERQE